MENRTAFWQQMPKRQERTASKSERRHHGAMRTVRIYGKTGGKRPVRYREAILVNGRSFRRWGRVPKGPFLVESRLTAFERTLVIAASMRLREAYRSLLAPKGALGSR